MTDKHIDQLQVMARNIFDYAISEFKREQDIDLRTDKLATARVYEEAVKIACRKWKKRAELVLPFITADFRGPQHMRVIIRREMLSGYWESRR